MYNFFHTNNQQIDKQYVKRIKYELDILQGAGLSSYFLIVQNIVDYVRKNPQWRISLQIHKYMHIPWPADETIIIDNPVISNTIPMISLPFDMIEFFLSVRLLPQDCIRDIVFI